LTRIGAHPPPAGADAIQLPQDGLAALLAALAPAAMPAICAAWCEHPLFSRPGAGPVCLIRFDAQHFDAGMFAATGIESPSQIARSVHARQAEFFFGRLAARAALALQGVPGAPIAIGPSRQPQWPDGTTGSISHIDGLAAAAVSSRSDCQGLGLDIESCANVGRDLQAMRLLVVDATEQAYLDGLRGGDQEAALLALCFSAKETLFKAAFAAVGRYFDFTAARVVRIDHRRGIIELIIQQTLCSDFRAGQYCRIDYRWLDRDVLMTGFAW
jgi:4'-phosphopantetheinyl transferase EntD